MTRTKRCSGPAVTSLLVVLLTQAPAAGGSLGDNVIIESEALGYALQYRVYTPDPLDEGLPVIYLTDGQWYAGRGDLPDLLDRMISKGRIEPVIAVFVDNRDPHDLSNNRRNGEFFCNRDYARFFEDELVPTIDKSYPTKAERGSRVILGLSFGGLNSACFGLLAHQTFRGIAMQSPALHPVPDIYDHYAKSPEHDLKVFLSTGTAGDNPDQALRMKRVIEARGYELRYLSVPFGHDWQNWGPLLDDVLEFYFSAAKRGTG